MVDYCRVPKNSPSRTWSTTVGSQEKPQSDVVDYCRVPKNSPSRTWSTTVGSQEKPQSDVVDYCRVPKNSPSRTWSATVGSPKFCLLQCLKGNSRWTFEYFSLFVRAPQLANHVPKCLYLCASLLLYFGADSVWSWIFSFILHTGV